MIKKMLEENPLKNQAAILLPSAIICSACFPCILHKCHYYHPPPYNTTTTVFLLIIMQFFKILIVIMVVAFLLHSIRVDMPANLLLGYLPCQLVLHLKD
mmetsp:Transcript_37955/g.62105  ORF Transcript_37955/g.62105 Transcript_37955/m.62105 type:complete len:99 (-) Transcript_37955:39-335(-)